ncbi:MAG: S41 family peptidase [Gemmataceae bacterium]
MAPRHIMALTILTALCGVGALSAKSSTSAVVSTPIREATHDTERRSEWAVSTGAYECLLTQTNRSADLREAISRCARRGEQIRRLTDPTYRRFAESLTMPQALAIYSEVLTKLQLLYPDRDRASVAKLYRSGLSELAAGLPDAAFPAGSEALVPMVRTAALASPSEAAAARDAIKALALEGHKASKAPVGLMVLECACGACAGLDDYTIYLHPGRGTEPSEPSAPSVSRVETLQTGGLDAATVGYVRIERFDKTLPVELDAAIAQLRARGARSLVLDLRGVPGGSFLAAIQTAERFVARGTIATAAGHQPSANRVYAAPGTATCDWPLVVLVDTNTASSAEVLAAALKERDQTLLVGQATYGKAAVQQLIPLESGGSLRVTLARLFGPDGRSYSGTGVAPSIPEANPQQQLEVALREASKLAAAKAG